jgi:nudix-type nucleoside diphosphatase (YffH/AdpP family)
MKKIVVHSEARLLDDFFKVDEAMVSFERFDGSMSPPVRRLCFERGDSVAAIVFNRDTRRVILVEQFRFPALKKGPAWLVEAVAGMQDGNDTAEATIRREVHEEIGYEIDRLHHIATFYPSPGGSSERIVLFAAEVTDAGKTGLGGGLSEDGEDVRLVEYSIDEMREAIARGTIYDAKTLIGVQWLLAQPVQGVPPKAT